MSAKEFLNTVFFVSFSICFLQLPFAGHSLAATAAAESAKSADAEKTQGSFNDAVKAETHSTAPEITKQQLSGGSAAAAAPFAEIKIEKADGENACTVQEIFLKNKELAGKIVRVKGKVVKYNPSIMGKNWIHIQDGSGEPMNNTHDLVATSTEAATVGEVVTVQGKLAANKDFGAGYSYVAIIEEAKLQK